MTEGEGKGKNERVGGGLVGGASRKGEGSGQARGGGTSACERRHPGDSHHCPLVTGSHGRPGEEGQGRTGMGAESAV